MRKLNVKVGEVLDVLESLLISHGYFYYEINELPCCTSCGLYAVPEEYGSKYLFFNQQMYDHAVNPETGEMVYDIWLAWDKDVDFETVRQAFAAKGITVTGGDLNQKICVKPERNDGLNETRGSGTEASPAPVR